MKKILTFLFALILSSNVFAQDPGKWIKNGYGNWFEINLNGTVFDGQYHESYSDTLKTKPYTFHNAMVFVKGTTEQIDQIHIVNVETSEVIYVVGNIEDWNSLYGVLINENYLVHMCGNYQGKHPNKTLAQIIDLNTLENQNVEYNYKLSELELTENEVLLDGKSIIH